MTAQRAQLFGVFSIYRTARCGRLGRTAAWLTIAVSGLALLAACGSSVSSNENADGGATTASDLAFVDEPDQPRNDDSDPGAGADGTVDGSTDTEVATTPTTSGSGLPAVTTIPGFTGGSLDGYTGVIGRLAPDEMLAESVSVAPRRIEGVQPLTGLPGVVVDRPAAVVKIDNGPAAAPQTGLNSADIVIEEEVEGGVTRLAAIFHSTASIVGPVRSGRTTDVALISGLGSPLLLYSGANDLTETILRRQANVQNRSHATSSGYWRDDDRKAPSNLYTDTAPHWASALAGPPPPQFVYSSGPDAARGETATSFSVNYPASTASWQWDRDQPDSNRWVRTQRGKRHDLVNGQPVTAANIVVVQAERVGTGMFDSAGGPVPEFVFVGSGPVSVFTKGKRIDGTWTKPTLTSVATMTDLNGDVIEMTPGRTWIQLIERDSGFLQ